ncbi:MAG: hypothetical protein WA057_06790 [Candidatus Magasanikiibacteriota bacterium]
MKYFYICLTVFNFLLFYVFDVKSLEQTLLYTLIFFVVFELLLRFFREILNKEKFYIFYKEFKVEYFIYFGVFIIIFGMLNFDLSALKGYLLTICYLFVSILEMFLKKYVYTNIAIRKKFIILLFIIGFLIIPAIVLYLGWYGIRKNIDTSFVMRAIVVGTVGWLVITISLYKQKKKK